MTEFDLRSPTTRILECAKCDGLVAGEAVGMRVELHCGYCGFDDVRELSGGVATDDGASAYRGKKRDGRGHVIRADLSVPPTGVAAQLKLADARAGWLEAKRALGADVSDDERIDREYRALWFVAGLANAYLGQRETVRARAALETVLEIVGTPAYRAIALARLARVAAVSNAADLGDKWLDAAPRGLRIPEVTSELRVAEALIARARGNAKEVLLATGQQHTADEFLGPTRSLAVALRADAHETLGEDLDAFRVYRGALGKVKHLPAMAKAYDLAPKTRRLAMWWGFIVLGAMVMIVASFAVIATRLLGDDSIGTAPLVCFFGGLVIVVVGAKR